MAEIKKAYRRAMAGLLPMEKLAGVYKEIDMEAMVRFSEAGYSWEEIKSGLMGESFYLERLGEAGAETALAKILPEGIEPGNIKAIGSDKAQEMGRIYQEVRERYQERLKDIFAPADQEALSALLDQGFTEREAHKFMQADGCFPQQIMSSQHTDAYANEVFRSVAEERGAKAEEEREACEEALEKYAELGATHYNQENEWSFFQEGQLAISLLMQDKFMPETVYEAMDARWHGQSHEHLDELENLMEKAQQVKRAYLNIGEVPAFGQGQSPIAVYRSYLKRYMDEKGLNQLTFYDEREIIGQMEADGYPAKYLPQAIHRASPVAIEPGRITEKYIEALLDRGEVKGAIFDTADASTLDMYKNCLETYEKGFRQEGHDGGITGNFRKYFDCLAVMSLIRKNRSEEEIEKAVMEFSPDVEDGRKKDYAREIMTKARRLIQRMQEWLENAEDKLPAGKSVKELAALKYKAEEIWKRLLQERLAITPSLAGRLWEKGVDRDMTEYCLLRFPDIDRNALHSVIEKSPRSILLDRTGLAESYDYADEILSSVAEQMAENAAQMAEDDALEEEYSRQTDLAAEGVEMDATSEYQLGQGALQLMMHGYDTLAIRNALLKKINHNSAKAKETNSRTVAPYVDNILQRVRNAYSRILSIKVYEQGKDIQANAAEAEYKAEMKKLWQKNKVMRPADDESITAKLLARHKKELVIAALLACSPWTALPGVTGVYVHNYLIRRAQQELLNAQRRLAKERPRKREKQSEDISEEYAREREDMARRHSTLPYSMKMDELVAMSLLMAGFSAAAVGTVLDEESPCRGQQQNYGASVASRAHNEVCSRISVEEENRTETWAGVQTPVRHRTITETVYAGGMNG